MSQRTFAILFSRGGHSVCWYARQGPDAVTMFTAAREAWLIHEKLPLALVAVETKESGAVNEDGELCGFDNRAHDNMITYYTRAGMKRVSA